MYVKFCECCGKKIVTKSKLKKYCSRACMQIMAKKREEENGQLCYICKNACGGCSWSIDFKPVNGWDAEPTIIRDSEGDIHSYKINNCPEFIRG